MSRSDGLSLAVNALLLAGFDCENPKNFKTSTVFQEEKSEINQEPMPKSGHPRSKTNQGVTQAKHTRPPFSYVALIAMAIQSSPKKRMKLHEICEYITDRFPYYKQRFPKWRNSIRHNLSLDDCFIKVQKPNGDKSGRGNYWTFDPRIEDRLNDPSSLKRRKPRRRINAKGQSFNFQREFSDSNEAEIRDPNEIFPGFLLHLPLMTQTRSEHFFPLHLLQLPLAPSVLP